MYPNTFTNTPVVKPTNNAVFIKDDIQLSLEARLSKEPNLALVNPTQEEIQHVSVLFKDRKLDVIENITYEVVSDIGRQEFSKLNTSLKSFTKKMDGVTTPGLFTLVSELTTKVDKADLPGLWERTCKAKPTMMARMLSVFNPKIASNSLQKRYTSLYSKLTEQSKGIEATIERIETGLLDQKHIQENNIRALENSFEIYYNSFQEVREQYIFTLYLEEFYRTQANKYQLEHKDHLHDLNVNKQVVQFDAMLQDIENKRLILHTALIKFPIIVKQNDALLRVCKNVVKDIDNTTLNTFNGIRSNLVSLGAALNAQQGMESTQMARMLEDQTASMALAITKDLAVKSERLAGEMNLQDANNVARLVRELGDLSQQIKRAKEQGRENMDRAAEVLNQSSRELARILEQDSSNV